MSEVIAAQLRAARERDSSEVQCRRLAPVGEAASAFAFAAEVSTSSDLATTWISVPRPLWLELQRALRAAGFLAGLDDGVAESYSVRVAEEGVGG